MVLNRRSLERSFSPMSKVKRKSIHVKKPVLNPLGSATKLKNTKRQSNVKVVVRVRPSNEKESGENYRSIIQLVDDKMLVFDPKIDEPSFFYHGTKQNCRDLSKKQNKDTTYIFDKVFGFTSTNQEVFEGSTKEMIKTLLDGYNCSVFVYGATGAGKTYTMLGSADSPGITYLTMVELYSEMEKLKDDKSFDLCVSYLEVYNENVRDLLQPSGPLHVREDSRAGVAVAGLRMETIDSADKLLAMLAQGNKNRTQHPTDANSESSRSHAVFQVHIRMTHKLSSQISLVKLSMVDLAGSERGSATGCTGARFTEGANINKSLLALGNCITNLADGLKHIPYRDSKLTRLLKDSLGGNCYTVMIANVSPSSKSYEDTQNTLKYATRAMKIKSTVKSNVVSCEMHVSQYARLVEELNRKVTAQNEEIHKLKQQLNSNATNEVSSSVKTDCDELHHWRKKLKDMYRIKKQLNSAILTAEMKRKILKWRVKNKQIVAARVAALCYDSEQLTQAMTRIEASQKQYKARAESFSSVIKTVKDQEQTHRKEIHSIMKMIKEAGFSEYLKEEVLVNDLMIETQNADIKSQHLKMLVTLQQNEMKSHYIMFQTICSMMKDYYLMLVGFGKETITMKESYQKAVRMMEGIKNITWEDLQNDDTQDLKELMRLSAALKEDSSCDEVLLQDLNGKKSSGLMAKCLEQLSGIANLSFDCNDVSSEREVKNNVTTSASNDSVASFENSLPESSLYYTDDMGLIPRTKFPKNIRKSACFDGIEETKTYSYEADCAVLKYEAEKISLELMETGLECHSTEPVSVPDLNNKFSCKKTSNISNNLVICDGQHVSPKAQEREIALLRPVDFKCDSEQVHSESHTSNAASESDLNKTFSCVTEAEANCTNSVSGGDACTSPLDSAVQQPMLEPHLNNTFSCKGTTNISNNLVICDAQLSPKAQEREIALLKPVDFKCDSEQVHRESHTSKASSEPDLNTTFSCEKETEADCPKSVTGGDACPSPLDSRVQQPESHILQPMLEPDLYNTFSCKGTSNISNNLAICVSQRMSPQAQERETSLLRPVDCKCDSQQVHSKNHTSNSTSELDLNATFSCETEIKADCTNSVTGGDAYPLPLDSGVQQPMLGPDLNNTFSRERQSQNESCNSATCDVLISSKKEGKELGFLRPPGVKGVKKVQATSHNSTLDSTFIRDGDTCGKPAVHKFSLDSYFVTKRSTGKCKDSVNKTFLQNKKVVSPIVPGKRSVLSNRNTANALQKDIVNQSEGKSLNSTGKIKNSMRPPLVQNSNINKENIYLPSITKRKIKRSDSMKLPVKKNQESMFPSKRVSPSSVYSGIASYQPVLKLAANRQREILGATPNLIYRSKTLPETITRAKETCLLGSS